MSNETHRQVAPLLVILGVILFWVWAVSAAQAGDKVTICHATSSETNPYVTLTISVNAVYGPGGHFNENGTTQAGHEDDYFGECQITTTTTQPPTTTTTSQVTTTTVGETTTTTQGSPGPGPSTTTTVIPFDYIPTTTAAPVPVVPVPLPGPEPTELPYTGIEYGLAAALASAFAATGATLLVRSNRKKV